MHFFILSVCFYFNYVILPHYCSVTLKCFALKKIMLHMKVRMHLNSIRYILLNCTTAHIMVHVLLLKSYPVGFNYMFSCINSAFQKCIYSIYIYLSCCSVHKTSKLKIRNNIENFCLLLPAFFFQAYTFCKSGYFFFIIWWWKQTNGIAFYWER